MMNYVTAGGIIYNYTNSVLNDELVRVFEMVDNDLVYKAEIELDQDTFHSLYYNSMYKQGSFAYGSADELYMGLLYSSLVFAASSEGKELFTTFEPFDRPVPEPGGRSDYQGRGVALSTP